MRTRRKKVILPCATVAAALVVACIAHAQRPGGGASGGDPGDLVARMMAFDADHDGKLIKSEISDDRLHRLFDRADGNHDGAVSKDELTALAVREATSDRGGGPGRGGPGGPMMGPRPGELLPPFLLQRLNVSADQKTQLDALQKEVDTALAKILTDEQKHRLEDMKTRGPGGFGPPGGRRRPPGGPPPGS
jgi:hypothetical protein